MLYKVIKNLAFFLTMLFMEADMPEVQTSLVKIKKTAATKEMRKRIISLT